VPPRAASASALDAPSASATIAFVAAGVRSRAILP
jgi:hypothetical protein